MFDKSAVSMLERAEGLLDDARTAGFLLANSKDAIAAIEQLEAIRRTTAGLAVALQAEVESSGVFRDDGHPSAKVMTRHVGRVSGAEASARDRQTRLARRLPLVADTLAEGGLGVEQFDLLSRVFANPRVREAMVEAQGWFVEQARTLSFRDFELAVREWERLADEDGAEPRNSRRHETRNFRLVHDDDLTWKVDGAMAALQGAAMHDIFEHYVAAERLADWEKARAEHGDAATVEHLPRTEAQRRADAAFQIFQDAAGSDRTAVPPGFTHNIVWTADAYEEMLERLDGNPSQPLDRGSYRCETLDGIPVEPVEAAANSMVSKIRRVVVDAAGVVIDLGRARRFTGSARLAAQLSATHCPWPGCGVPTSHCEIDHTLEHSRGGRTNPGNGAPFCGRHNRHKQKGFTVWRDPSGTWHTYRPDGSEIR